MPETIQEWLGNRLGVLLDMSPQMFGRNTKDGRILAKLLYTYGVIPVSVLEKIKESKNYFECLENWLVLKPWLEYIGVTQEESTFQEMARGEGSVCITVFYAVYLNLERKDRLHYLSAQKERRFAEDCGNRFKVEWIPERYIKGEEIEKPSSFAKPLIEEREIIDLHREKCKEVVANIKKMKEKFEKALNKQESKLGPVSSKFTSSINLKKNPTEADDTIEKINVFEKNHNKVWPDLTYAELIELKNIQEGRPRMNNPNFQEAKNIVKNIKKNKKAEVYARNFNIRMQQMIMDEQWKIISEKQNKDFEDVVCAYLLKQSQYEKQMANKLSFMRHQKKVLAQNRQKIESFKVEHLDKELDDLWNNKMEMKGEDLEYDAFEKERIAELHRRRYDDKVRHRRATLKLECRKICEALVSIAIRVCDVRSLTACQVPKSFMKDLKELFFKDLPIFDLLENLEVLCKKNNESLEVPGECDEEEGIATKNEKCHKIKIAEAERQSMLDECDFYDYINLTGPWMLDLFFPDAAEKEVKHLVLGYIVHKLLANKYPSPNAPAVVKLKPMKAGIIVGLIDETACTMLIELMEASNILVVRVNDAINFVLSAYKEELSVVRDIDINFQKATAFALKDKSESRTDKIKKKIVLIKKDDLEKGSLLGEDQFLLDKETQTPRVIPEDDPLLTPNAELGKLAFEALGAGDPVPDPVIISAILAYVSSKQENYSGWVLVNYPFLYSQASDLEFALTGYRVLPLVHDTQSLQDVEGFSFREGLGNPFAKDDYAESRTSRLVPKPNHYSLEMEDLSTYFQTFIKLEISSSSRRRSLVPSLDLTPVEKCYYDKNIFFNLEFNSFNFQAIKNIGKIILGETNLFSGSGELEQKTSVEIFGSGILELNDKYEKGKKKSQSKKETSAKKVPKEITTDLELDLVEEKELDEQTTKKDTEETPKKVKPGDPDWEWAKGPLPEPLQIALASLWENMEAVYIEDFKNLFFCLRVHRSNVISYSAFIRNTVRSLMKRPDDKQKVLTDFQIMFNDIDVDLRPDVDVKCELYVRVSELEQALMLIADEMKANSIKDIMKVAQDGWVSDQMATLVNAYLQALQLEADRCIETFQVILDYYTALQQKVPEEKTLPKVIIPKVQLRERKYTIISNSNKSNMSSPRISESKRSSKANEQYSKMDRYSKSRSWTRKKSSDVSFLTGAAEFILDILVNLRLPDDGLTPFHNLFIDSANMVKTEIKSTAEGCLAEAKKIVMKNTKKGSETKVSASLENLSAEWVTALENELDRFLFRIKLILARGILEMNEFLTTILNILSSLVEEINEMYHKKIQSIKECCRVFSCAIEEEIAIQPQLELKEDKFVVNEDILLFPNPQEKISVVIDEERQKYRFNIEQLSLICKRLQKVAPDGEIIRKSMIYILEDLRVLKGEVENATFFPEMWYELEAEDLIVVFNIVFQDLEIVHWKDFIIYALDLPVPSESEILSMRKAFRENDPLATELITRENYDKVTFWFEATLDHFTEVDRNEKAKDLLYKMYQVDEFHSNYSALLLAFCKDENPFVGFTKALALAMGNKIAVKDYRDEFLSYEGEGARSSDYDVIETYHRNSYKKTTDCCRTTSSGVSKKCIPKERLKSCDCKDPVKSVSEDEGSLEEDMPLSEQGAEAESLFYFGSQPSERSSFTSMIPYNILFSLLKASYPSLTQLSILLDCKQTFQETLNQIYDSLQSHDDSVEVHQLLLHPFISRLLQSTNKFKFISLHQKLIMEIDFQRSAVRSSCFPDKLNFNFCLN